MIYVVEIRSVGWEHEHVNSGFLRQLRKARPNDDIVFFSAIEHIECVRNLVDVKAENIGIHVMDGIPKRISWEEDTKNYHNTIEEIINAYDEIPTDIFFTATCEEILYVLKKLVDKYMINFHCVFHQRLERNLLGSDGEKSRMHSLLNSIDSNQIDYICYSPLYADNLVGIIDEKAISKFRLIHHPFIRAKDKVHRDLVENNTINIAVVGAGLNNVFIDFLKLVEDRKPNVHFKILDSRHKKEYESDYVTNYCGENESIDCDSIRHLIQSCDYVLITYTNGQYKLTASGIFWDAVSCNVPILSFGSPYSRYYENYNIGVIADSGEELLELMHSDNYCEYAKGEERLMEATEEYNCKQFKLY